MAESSVVMTEEQKEFLKALEEEFKDRYTEKDEDFKATMEKKIPDPPIIEDWYDNRPNWKKRHQEYRYPYDRGGYHSRPDRSYDHDGYTRKGPNRKYNPYDNRSSNHYNNYRPHHSRYSTY